MLGTEKLKAYAEKTALPILKKASHMLSERFHSNIQLTFNEPDVKISPDSLIIDIVSVLPSLGFRERIITVYISSTYRWFLTFFVPDSWIHIHFSPVLVGTREPRAPIGLVPFAVASFAYIRTNIFAPFQDVFYIPDGAKFRLEFSQHSLLLSAKDGIFSIWAYFDLHCLLLNGVINDFHFEKYVPYGDVNLQEAMRKIIYAYRIRQV